MVARARDLADPERVAADVRHAFTAGVSWLCSRRHLRVKQRRTHWLPPSAAVRTFDTPDDGVAAVRMASIEFRTLGGLDLVAAAHRDLRPILQQPKRIALLAYLAIAGRNAFVRRDKLLALFWPELDSTHARGSLRTTLHRLRQALGDDLFDTRGAEEVRVADDVLWCDANVLRAAASAGDDARVVELYRGPLLDGFFVSGGAPEFEQWLEDERRQTRDLAAASAWTLATRHEEAGNTHHAIANARRAVDITRHDEQAMRRYLRLLVRVGDHASAITTYDEYRRYLAEEFQVEPSAETCAVVEPLRPAVTEPPRPRSLPANGFSLPAAATATSRASRTRRWRGPYAGIAAAALVLVAGVAYARTHHVRLDGPAWERLMVDGSEPLARSHAVAVLDSTGRSVLLFGGRTEPVNVGDLWRLTGLDSGGTLRWTRLDAGAGRDLGPHARWLSAAVYNPRTDRMIVFGGAVGWTSPCIDELWILKNVSGRAGSPAWERVPHPAGAAWPAARGDHRLAYDVEHNRVMLYGGHDCIAPVFTDYWVLRDADGSTGPPTWERLAPDTSAGAPPRPRGQAIGYSPGSNRLVVFGGVDTDRRVFFNEAWTLTNANGLGGQPVWRRVDVGPMRPAPRINMAYGFDPSTNRLVVALGRGDGAYYDDAWVLVGADGTPPRSRWERLALSSAVPQGRETPAMVFDPSSERLVIIGGAADGSLDDIWVLRNATRR